MEVLRSNAGVSAMLQASVGSAWVFQGSWPDDQSHNVPEWLGFGSTGGVQVDLTNWCFVGVCVLGGAFPGAFLDVSR